MLYLPHGGIVISTRDAHLLATTVFSAADFAHQRGARLDPRILSLAVDITSALGASEEPSPQLNEPIEHEHIDASEAAKILNCSPRNVRDLAKRKRLPGTKVAGSWQFLRDEVEVFKQWRH